MNETITIEEKNEELIDALLTLTLMDSLTANFQLNASLLSTFSPSLAAHHASRARRTAASHPYALALSPLHCPRCSRFPVTTRVIAKQRRTSGTKKTMHSLHAQGQSSKRGPRVYKSCAACGYVGDEVAERKEGGRELNVPRATANASRTASPLPHFETLASPSISTFISPEVIKVPEAASNVHSNSTTTDSKRNVRASVSGLTPVSRSSSPIVPASSVITHPTSNLSQSSSSSTKRQKKRSGLQEMLARSKEQSGKRKAGEAQDGGGLAAFLRGL